MLEYRTFYGVLLTMAADLRKRGVTHVVMEASGVYTEPVSYFRVRSRLRRAAPPHPAALAPGCVAQRLAGIPVQRDTFEASLTSPAGESCAANNERPGPWHAWARSSGGTRPV